MKKQQIIETITEQGVLPLFYHENAQLSAEVVRALYRAGVRAVEYTNRGTQALTNVILLRQICDAEMPEMQLGIGTIKNKDSAQQFIDAGVDFIISPGFSEEVADVANEHEVLWIPGCMTPSEIMKAEKSGVSMVKLFPGNLLGPAFVKAIIPLFPKLMFMPTGGVTLDIDNLQQWFHAGVSCVGLGSNLISKELLVNKNFEEIERLAKLAIEMVKEARGL